MKETAEDQRIRLYQKRLAECEEELIACLECKLKFRRVGSHVVQVHGYKSTLEYRRAGGLMQKETRTKDYAHKMKLKASAIENLALGKRTRFVKGGRHGDVVREFWQARKATSDYKKINSTLRNK
jgi:hypothetical protein